MNKSDRTHLSRVADIGCIACINIGYQDTPAEIHHIRAGQGMGQRSKHKKAIPLCPTHHRTGGHGVAFHAGKETWQRQHGTESELLEQVSQLLKRAEALRA